MSIQSRRELDEALQKRRNVLMRSTKVVRRENKPAASDDTRYRDFGKEEVNERFNMRELVGLTEENADTKIFNLGSQSSFSSVGRCRSKPINCCSEVRLSKEDEEAWTALEELQRHKGCCQSIAVFDNIGRGDNRSILTELRTKKAILMNNRFGKGRRGYWFQYRLICLRKSGGNVVDWIERSLAAYIYKPERALSLHHSVRKPSATQDFLLLQDNWKILCPCWEKRKASLQEGRNDPQDTAPQAKALQAKMLSEKLILSCSGEPEITGDYRKPGQQRAKRLVECKNVEVVMHCH